MRERCVLRVLLVDFLDSYTFNIPAFIQQSALHYEVDLTFHVERYDVLCKKDVSAVADHFDAIILSPGPGTVESAEDLGDFVPALFEYAPAPPVFGICLGFQAICKAFGATVQRLVVPHHGIVSDMRNESGALLGRKATRYHSLEVRLNDESLKHLYPQAYALNFNDDSQTLMEVAHRRLPFWGVQYHPESVYSQGCDLVVQPFLQAAIMRGLYTSNPTGNVSLHMKIRAPDGLEDSELHNPQSQKYTTSNLVGRKACDRFSCLRVRDTIVESASPRLTEATRSGSAVLWKRFQYDVDLTSCLGSSRSLSKDFVLLDSSTKGEWDILACASTAFKFGYSIREQKLTYGPLNGQSGVHVERSEVDIDDMWRFLEDHSTKTTFYDGPPDVPFWGGFLGYFSYELGLKQLGLDPYPNKATPNFDDVQLLWSTETLVYHRLTQDMYLISLHDDQQWIARTYDLLTETAQTPRQPCQSSYETGHIVHPKSHEYINAISEAQNEMKAGNSYELCLTAPSRMFIPGFNGVQSDIETHSTLIELFRKIRSKNPAAFMSLFKMGNVSFISASPEEFLSYDAKTRIACMKPIKGTLSKIDDKGENVTMDQAKQALNQPKVIAENLMIVDLVRNDLYRVSEHVECPALLWVEEIETMYQLVSTIQAKVKPGKSAWDLLRSCLPPGSMTGAPKRRSCQILQALEKDFGSFRGLYSGVVGYIDVRGNCRTSVSIRNAAKYPGEHYWRIGAGGAITTLSDPQDEWQERQLKAQSISRVFAAFHFEVLETILWDPKTRSLAHAEKHAERLIRSLRFFGFQSPLKMSTSDERFLSKRVNQVEKLQEFVVEEVNNRLSDNHKNQLLRLSLKFSPEGNMSLVTSIIGRQSMAVVRVFLDPGAIAADDIKHFIEHKTTNRNHYEEARARTCVTSSDEVLLFRHSCSLSDSCESHSKEQDVLMEGSYTNVAVLNNKTLRWQTPSTHCLPGIQRQILLDQGEIDVSDILRNSLQPGTHVKLFNSVRGCFDGVISTLPPIH